jgi:ABC-type sugar transport system permease subunit
MRRYRTALLFVGCALQFVIGTALAFLCSQPISGKNFFRVVFFIQYHRLLRAFRKLF